ncbi:hypothetical protein B0H16DRAFT_117130 [Mycena metata]|uniref:F-box domain-containing protein n=1 Tax=Mycena metata TaxID=1033252 RepID=A0AAD7K021_9AGAR|nr:hypothetical protein B0H16DRAFT_117130 [Mycena metata]
MTLNAKKTRAQKKNDSESVALPQELIDAIVSEVDDKGSLEACSLSSSSLRGPSQRILIHSLTLHGHGDFKVRTFLTEAPHIASYITDLKLKLWGYTDLVELETLCWVLGKLTRVARCTITGVFLNARWGNVNPTLSTALLDFIFRQDFQSLHVALLKDIPPPVFRCLIKSAGTLSFYNVDLQSHSGARDEVGDDSYTRAPNRSLLLDAGCAGVAQHLRSPGVITHTSTILCLSVMLEQSQSLALIKTASETLHYLRLDCTVLNSPEASRILPFLPRLRTLEVALAVSRANAVFHPNGNVQWFIDVVCNILTTYHKAQGAPLPELILSYIYARFVRPAERPRARIAGGFGNNYGV